MKNESFHIVIITQGVTKIVQPLIESGHKVVGIIESAPRRQGNDLRIKKLFIYHILKKLSRLIYKETSLKELCLTHSIPYFYYEKGMTIKLKEWLNGKAVDLLVVYSMSQLLPEDIYTIPKYHAINLHPSLLPSYRGPNPWFWIYYNMEKTSGVTVHFIDQGEDTGNIICQEEFKIPLGIKMPELIDIAIGKIGVKLLARSINNIRTVKTIKQPSESPTIRAKNIKSQEHMSVIDWNNWPIERIWHLLCGTELWLNAIKQPSGLFKGHRWIILNYEKCDMRNFLPGKLYTEDNSKFIACRDGKIYIKLKFNIKVFLRAFFEAAFVRQD